MSSDRTQFKQAVAGSIGDSRSVAVNPLQANGCVAQDAQRFESVQFTAAVAANTSANYSVARLDRPVQIKDFRVLPSAAVTVNGNTTFILGYTNDNGGTLQNIVVINTNQNANLGLGNLAQWTSVNILTLANTQANALNNSNAGNNYGLTPNNLLVPSGSHLILRQVATTPSEQIPAGSEFQFIWEEV